VAQQRNKSRLVGDKIDKRFIKNQAIPATDSVQQSFQQTALRQQAGGVVRGAEKQAVQRRRQSIEDRRSAASHPLTQQILHHLAVHRLQRAAVLCKTGNDDHRPPRLKAVDEGEDRFGFAVAGEDPRRRQ
jgi:hypothetical protein